MEIIVSNCVHCPFMQEDFDPDCFGKDTIETCTLLKSVIRIYNSFEKPKDVKMLKNCPLKKENIIIKFQS